jgi:predicted site-specific integrase-resolvase
MGQLKGTDVRRMFGVTRLTLHRYVAAGKLHPIKINSKVYLYDEEEVYRLLGQGVPRGPGVAVYARVNGPSQKDELQDQIRRVTDFANKNGLSVSKTYWDCSKSLEFSRSGRKGLHELMLDVARKKVGMIVVESPDRISQIGHELFEMMMSNYRVRVLYASSEPVNPRYLTETTKELTHVIKELKRMLDRSRPPSGTDYGL